MPDSVSKLNMKRSKLLDYRAVIVLAAGVLVFTVSYYFRPLDPVDETVNDLAEWKAEPQSLPKILGPLLKGTRVKYTFRSPVKGLSGFITRWATYKRRNKSTLRCVLAEAGTGRVIRKVVSEAEKIEDFGYWRWRFRPIAGSRERLYEIIWDSPDADEANCLAFLFYESSSPQNGLLTHNGREVSGALPSIELTSASLSPFFGSYSMWAAIACILIISGIFYRPEIKAFVEWSFERDR